MPGFLNPGDVGPLRGKMVKAKVEKPTIRAPKPDSSSLEAAQHQQQRMWQQYYQQYAQQYQQWVAMYQQMCVQAAGAVQAQSGQTTPAVQAQQQLQMQAMRMQYPSYGGFHSPPVVQPQVQRDVRTQSAPLPAAQPAAPAQPAPVQVQPQPAVQPPAQPEVPRRRLAELVRPGMAFRLFMFYYLFCSPALPEWQRTAFIGALCMFYMYNVDLMGYLFPTWRENRRNPQNQDLDVIPPGPDDVDNNRQDPIDRDGPLTKRELVERFVVGLIASLVPGWNPIRVGA